MYFQNYFKISFLKCSSDYNFSQLNDYKSYSMPYFFISIVSLILYAFKLKFENLFEGFKKHDNLKRNIIFFIIINFMLYLLFLSYGLTLFILGMILIIFCIFINLNIELFYIMEEGEEKNKHKDNLHNYFIFRSFETLWRDVKKNISLVKFTLICQLYYDVFRFFTVFLYSVAIKLLIYMLFITINKYIKHHFGDLDKTYFVVFILFLIAMIASNTKYVFDNSDDKEQKENNKLFTFTPSFIYNIIKMDYVKKSGKQMLYYILENITDFSFCILMIYKTFNMVYLDLQKYVEFYKIDEDKMITKAPSVLIL